MNCRCNSQGQAEFNSAKKTLSSLLCKDTPWYTQFEALDDWREKVWGGTGFMVSNVTESRQTVWVHILCICMNKGAQQPCDSPQNPHLSQGGVTAYYSGCLTHSVNKLYFQLLIVLHNFAHSGWKFPWKMSASGQIFFEKYISNLFQRVMFRKQT